MTVYPKDYSMKDFAKAYSEKMIEKGSIIKVDSSGKKCVGIFKGVRPGFMESFWQLYIHPQFWIEGKNPAPSKNDSADFSIVSSFLRGVTVLASSRDTWDQKTGLEGSGSPPKRRISTETLDLPSSLSRNSSQVSFAQVSPIHASDLQKSEAKSPPRRRTSTENIGQPTSLSRNSSQVSRSSASPVPADPVDLQGSWERVTSLNSPRKGIELQPGFIRSRSSS